MTDHLDREDLAALARGDERALCDLHRRHATKVFRFVLGLMRDEAAAEDVLNEAFIELWRRAGAFRGDSAVATWLLSIARNKAIDRLRKRREAPLDEEAAAVIADESDTPEESLLRSDRAAQVRRQIARLSPIHREIIELVYYQEQSVAQAARLVGVPEGTVKTRMFAARKQLARLLAESGLDESLATS
ncbi:MAG: sigma-70 family RNA polymerase sigma factor [Salinarimonas sp.]